MLSNKKLPAAVRASALVLAIVAVLAVLSSSPLAGQQGAPATERPQTGSRSPVAAGALSLLVFPGVGSYYAGNSRHGTTHLVVGALSVGLAYAGAANCNIFGDCPGEALILAGFGAFVINAIWSTVTAVQDANAYNDRARRLSVHFDPRVESLSRRETGAGVGYGRSGPTYGLRLLRIEM